MEIIKSKISNTLDNASRKKISYGEIEFTVLKAISKDDIIDGVITIPKEVEVIDSDVSKFFIDSIKKNKDFEFSKLQFEKDSQLQILKRKSLQKCPAKIIDFSNCDKIHTLETACMYDANNTEQILFSKNIKINHLGHSTFCRLLSLKSFDFSIFSNLAHIPLKSFLGARELPYIDLSEMTNLQSIESRAFSYCYNLFDIKFPKNSNLIRIREAAFSFTENLKEIDLSNQPELQIIDKYAFAEGNALKKINLENCPKLKFIGNDFFTNDLDELNLKNCSENLLISYKEKNKCYNPTLKKLIISSNLINYYNTSCDELFDKQSEVPTQIEIYNNKQLLKFDNKLFSKLSKIKLNWLSDYVIMNKHNFEINIDLLNSLKNKEELKIYQKNKNFIDATIEKIVSKSNLDYKISYLGAINIIKSLGIFGFDITNAKKSVETQKENLKQEKLRFKNLLAKNIVLATTPQKYKDSKKYGDIIQKTADKLAKISTIMGLVDNYTESKIINNKNLHKLIIDTKFFKENKKNNVLFAEFFIENFDEITEQCLPKINSNFCINENFDDTVDKQIVVLHEIYNNFNSIIENTNKIVLTRSDNERLTIHDCKFSNKYKNIEAENEDLATYCSRCHLRQEDFEKLQNIFNTGKANKENQYLKICKDNQNYYIKYEFIEKDNPIGLVLGNISNSCQKLNKIGESCMLYGATEPNSGFVVFKKDDNIIAQSWVWYDKNSKTIAFDNIEVPEKYNKLVNNIATTEFKKCFKRTVNNFISTMESTDNKVENIIVGAGANDIKFLENEYPIEKDSSKILKIKDEKIKYSDVCKEDGQFVIIKDGKNCEITKTKQLDENQL